MRHKALGAVGSLCLVVAASAAAPRSALADHERTIRVRDAGGKSFAVTLRAATPTDPRLLDYLAKSVRVVAVDPRSEVDRDLAKGETGTPATPGESEVGLSLRSLSGSDAASHHLIWPDGFDLVRPGLLRAKRELVAGLAANRDFQFDRRPSRPAKYPFGHARTVTGTLQCRATASGQTITSPMPFVRVKIGSLEKPADANGTFSITGGAFGSGQYDVTLGYDSTVPGPGGMGTRLLIMDELESARSDTLIVNSRPLLGDVVDLGVVQLETVDCELWRIGAGIVGRYHDLTQRSTPAGALRIMRWSNVHDPTPYAFYDYVVVGTNWGTGSDNEKYRRQQLTHEFGHTIRHVADGSLSHWNWDNFRWAYARKHSGCQITNTQYAFNEGWADYWQAASMPTEAQDPCGAYPCANADCTAPPQLDWNEDLVEARLQVLSDSSSPEFMVLVLQANPGSIHSIREFEVKYCAAVTRPNSQCDAAHRPLRPAPASCPPGYADDGATCRLENSESKESYDRGPGEVPNSCGAGNVLDAGLCYPACPSGYAGVGPVCWRQCPEGYPDQGAFCGKPQSHDRGAGYGWQPGDPAFDLNPARQRCEKDHGTCEQNGLIFYPRCRDGYHAVGCCICSPNCPSDMPDIGVSCAKQNRDRGPGWVPTACAAGKQYEAGLCYTPCRTDFSGVGPRCWGKCRDGYEDHGATCYKAPDVIVKY